MKLFAILALIFLISNLDAQKVSEIIIPIHKGVLSAELTEVNKKTLIISIAGSGPTDRDGNNPQMKNNSLKMLSDSLVSRNISTLRIDKRGIGNSVVQDLKEENMKFDTFVYDLSLWVDSMKKRGYEKIYLMGHSEGSLVAIISCQKNKKINGFISLSGAGTSADSILISQIKSQPEMIQTQVIACLDTLKRGFLLQNAPVYLYSLFRPSVQPYMISWIKYNPSKEIAKLDIPILILQGDSDLQVTIEDANKLKVSSTNATLHFLKATNHLMKVVKNSSENQNSYLDSKYPLNPELVRYIYDFVK